MILILQIWEFLLQTIPEKVKQWEENDVYEGKQIRIRMCIATEHLEGEKMFFP